MLRWCRISYNRQSWRYLIMSVSSDPMTSLHSLELRFLRKFDDSHHVSVVVVQFLAKTMEVEKTYLCISSSTQFSVDISLFFTVPFIRSLIRKPIRFTFASSVKIVYIIYTLLQFIINIWEVYHQSTASLHVIKLYRCMHKIYFIIVNFSLDTYHIHFYISVWCILVPGTRTEPSYIQNILTREYRRRTFSSIMNVII
jgi:hypothetical protein